MGSGSCVDILDVSVHAADGDPVTGVALASPIPGQAVTGYVFLLRGVVLTTAGAPTIDSVAVIGGDRLARGVTRRVSETRHEFSMAVGCASGPPDFELDVSIDFEGGTRVPLVRIAGRRAPLESGFEPAIQPLAVTTLGRSGSTIFTAMLGAHPGVIAYRPLGREPRAAAYWTDVFRELADPVSSTRQLAHGGEPDMSERGWWLGAGAPQEHFEDDLAARWLGRDHVRSLAGYCMGRVESLYSLLAEDAGKQHARYFVEKTRPDSITATLRELCPGSREVILVRDLRDMFCSMLAWSERMGAPQFGLDGSAATEQLGYVRGLAESLAARWEALGDRCHLVRYEDLVLDPEPALRGVLDHLGLEPSPGVLAAMVAVLAGSATATEAHRTTGGGRQSIGRWRLEFDDSLQQRCHTELGPVLARLGYDTR